MDSSKIHSKQPTRLSVNLMVSFRGKVILYVDSQTKPEIFFAFRYYNAYQVAIYSSYIFMSMHGYVHMTYICKLLDTYRYVGL